MAQIFPQSPNYHQPPSPAEKKLYDVFAGLGDEYTVLCDRTWRTPGKPGESGKGNADFIIAHPDRGILVIEVKGGSISYDAATDTWTSGGKELKRSPFQQVERIRYLLRDLLSSVTSSASQFPLGEAVAFPDLTIDRFELPASVNPNLVFDSRLEEDVTARIEKAFNTEGLSPENAAVFGNIGIKILLDTLSASISLDRTAGTQIRTAGAELLELTEAQFSILDYLSEQSRVHVKGGAGTGKTLLAVEQARRLAAQGHRVLFTCHSKALAAHIRSSLDSTLADSSAGDLVVSSFHSFCTAAVRNSGLDTSVPSDQEAKQEYFRKTLPENMVTALGDSETRYDAILVDEAQDFDAEWINLLELLLPPDDSEAQCFLFSDENQAIFGSDFAHAGSYSPVTLPKNCRNTNQIHRVLRNRLGDKSMASGVDGPDIEVHTYSTRGELRKLVSSLLTDLSKNDIDVSDTVVLSGLSPSKSELLPGPVGSYVITGKPKASKDVLRTTVHSFKGLEARVVLLLADFDRLPEDKQDEAWYIGVSRAISGLFVLLRDDDMELDASDPETCLDRALRDVTLD